MQGVGELFRAINVPNATTWLYMSLIIAIAAYFQFKKPVSLRNLDLLLLYLFAPVMLFLKQMQSNSEMLLRIWADSLNPAMLYGDFVSKLQLPGDWGLPVLLSIAANRSCNPELIEKSAFPRFFPDQIWLAYALLLVLSALLMIRLFCEFFIRRRAHTEVNFSRPAILWLIAMMVFILIAKSLLSVDEGLVSKNKSLILQRLTDSITSAAQQSNPELRNRIPTIFALASHAAIVGGIFGITAWHFRSWSLGFHATLLYLLLPYTALNLRELSHSMPSVFILIALLSYRWPVIAGLWLGAASALSYFPGLLLPMWFFFYRSGHGRFRFLFAFLIVLITLISIYIVSNGWDETLRALRERIEWQAWLAADKPDTEGLWIRGYLHQAYRIPIFLGYMVLVAFSIFWPRPKTLEHILIWTAILIIGIQFWYADAGGIFILWYLPFVVIILLADKQSKFIAPEIHKETDWLYKLLVFLFPVWMESRRRLYANTSS